MRVGELRHGKKRTRRAMVATLDNDESATLFWETLLPRPLKGQADRFLVTPLLEDDDDDEEAESAELELPLHELESLLPFELQEASASVTTADKDTAATWKERGDALLQLGDASAAVPYYEYALFRTCPHHHKPAIGASILAKKDRLIQVAEVDCLNEDDDSMDITWVTSGKEECIPQRQTLLTMLEPDHQEHLQERTLLNLTRCLMQLMEGSSASSSSSRHGQAYAKAAVLASSLALALATTWDSDRTTTALLLRAQAHGARHTYPEALQDVRQILATHPRHGPGRELLRQLQTEQTTFQKKDKWLARQVCQWVEASTAPPGSSQPAVPRRTKYDKAPASTR